MRGFGELVTSGILAGALCPAGLAQAPATPAAAPVAACATADSPGCANLQTTVAPLPTATDSKPAPGVPESATSPAAQGTPQPVPQPTAKTLEIPAGTKVLLTIRSAINTKTAQAGDGVYLQSSFPVIANGRAVIPAGVYVQGVVDSVERHIRIKGTWPS